MVARTGGIPLEKTRPRPRLMIGIESMFEEQVAVDWFTAHRIVGTVDVCPDSETQRLSSVRSGRNHR